MHQLVLSSYLVKYYIHTKNYSIDKVAELLGTDTARIQNILNQKAPLRNEEVGILVENSGKKFLSFIFSAVPEEKLPEKLKIIKKLYKKIDGDFIRK